MRAVGGLGSPVSAGRAAHARRPGWSLVGCHVAPHLIGMDSKPAQDIAETTAEPPAPPTRPAPALPKEIGGVDGPEPTRYGDWQHKGRCTDF
jgi:hypothetical protein